MCGTVGESVFPVIIGWMMGTYGDHAFPIAMAALTFLMIFCYLVAHTVGLGLLSRLLESRQLINRIYDWTGVHTNGEQTRLLECSNTHHFSGNITSSQNGNKDYMSLSNHDTTAN